MPPRSTLRISAVQPCHDTRVRKIVSSDAAHASTANVPTSSFCSCASRGSANARSCSSIRKPIGSPRSATGIALRYSSREPIVRPSFQFSQSGPGELVSGLTFGAIAAHDTCAGHSLVAATRLPSRVQAIAATTRSSRVRSASSAPSRSLEPVIQLVTSAGRAPRRANAARVERSRSTHSSIVRLTKKDVATTSRPRPANTMSVKRRGRDMTSKQRGPGKLGSTGTRGPRPRMLGAKKRRGKQLRRS
jgi:hypothetical protein